tara:strand:- start:405 stop:977 length:573 start_codon:yes stop_codon:yes gene_type:complete
MRTYSKESKLLYFKDMINSWGFTWNGLFKNSSGEWFLCSQILIILFHLIPPYALHLRLIKENIIWNIIISSTSGIILLFGFIRIYKALISIGGSLSPLPKPKREATLKLKGSYQNCRHPIYQSILLCSLAINIYFLSAFHLILFLLLCIVLRGKARYEEKELKLIHGEYNRYISNTPAIFSGILLLDWRE